MVKKKRPVLTPHKMALRYAKHEIKLFRKAVESEVDVAVRLNFDKRYTPWFKKMLANQAVVTMVSGIEYYTRHFVRKLIDENQIDVSSFFDGNLEQFIQDTSKEFGKKVTTGLVFSQNFDFTNATKLNSVMSQLLGLDFFETLKQLDDDKDSFKFHKRARSLHANFTNFIKIFGMRNAIVHGLKRYEIKPTQLRSLAENTYFYTENLSIFYSYYDYLNGRLSYHVTLDHASQKGRWYLKIEAQKAKYQLRRVKTSSLP